MTANVVLALVPLVALAAPLPTQPLPATVALPADFVQSPPDGRQFSVAFGKEEFKWVVPAAQPGGKESSASATLEGRVWLVTLKRTPPATPQLTEAQVFAAFRPGLEAQGWRYLSRPPVFVFHRVGQDTESYLQLEGNSTFVTLRVAEKASRARVFEPPAPGKTAEAWKSGEAPPYLPPFPGGALGPARVLPEVGFEWAPPGAVERRWVGAPTLTLEWTAPPDASPFEVCTALQAGLEKAGWHVMVKGSPGSSGDAVMLASFDRDARDLYAVFHVMRGAYAATLADMGLAAEARHLKEALAKDGHVALYGIYFDTDKATLKGSSEATLQQVLSLLKADATLKLLVEGHTDNEGTREHNQPLSEARARTVKGWLVAHGIGEARLSTQGFADTHPVADNRSSEGRAKNRRVELSRPK